MFDKLIILISRPLSSGGKGPMKVLLLVGQSVSMSVGELLVFLRNISGEENLFFCFMGLTDHNFQQIKIITKLILRINF